MPKTTLQMTPEAWFRRLFSCKAALEGGVVRRKIRDMERMVGRELFYREIARRGFSAVENDEQVVVFCNASLVRLVVDGGQTLEESLVQNPRGGFLGRVS